MDNAKRAYWDIAHGFARSDFRDSWQSYAHPIAVIVLLYLCFAIGCVLGEIYIRADKRGCTCTTDYRGT